MIAHALSGTGDLPVPEWLFTWAAAIVLVASFVALASLWQRPRLASIVERRLFTLPRALEPLAGAIGLAAFVLVVYSGLRGWQNPEGNLAPTAIFVGFWVGVPFACALFGDIFAPFNPWRAIGRATGWIAARLGGRVEPLPYPAKLGRWPAAAGLLAFAWVELVYTDRTDPSALAVLALVYAAINVLGMSLYGERAWTANGDAFAVYFGVIAKLAPIQWRDRTAYLRPPGTAVAQIAMVPGTLALILASIATTSFDGFAQGSIWSSMASPTVNALRDAGMPNPRAAELVSTVGLLIVVGVVAGMYFIGVTGMRRVDGRRSSMELAREFGPSLAPIAFAYVVAHYLSLLVFQGQALAYLISDPLDRGWDLFGTASWSVDYSVLSANATWYLQIAALIAGHVVGLVLSHDRAVTLYRDTRRAQRSQYWMLAVMVSYTSLALWLLSVASR